ncbi:MAG: thiol peroxidase [Chlamydiia bacterium]|nr:thiol peroxidase [Chlamydiia bacterium]
MAEITLKGNRIRTVGNLPPLRTKAPDFKLVDKDLKDRTLAEFHGKKKILATVPSLDTGTCSLMTKHFNETAKKHPGIVILTISADLPFAQKRFCEAENVHNVLTLSMMRDKEFGKHYGLLIQDGPLAGILARAVLLLDEKDHVLYSELVAEITHEPNYHKVTELLGKH